VFFAKRTQIIRPDNRVNSLNAGFKQSTLTLNYEIEEFALFFVQSIEFDVALFGRRM